MLTFKLEKTPGIKQTMCDIFLEGAFFSFFLMKISDSDKEARGVIEKIRTSHVAIPMESLKKKKEIQIMYHTSVPMQKPWTDGVRGVYTLTGDPK